MRRACVICGLPGSGEPPLCEGDFVLEYRHDPAIRDSVYAGILSALEASALWYATDAGAAVLDNVATRSRGTGAWRDGARKNGNGTTNGVIA